MADIHQALYYKLANTGAVTTIATGGVFMAGDVPQGTSDPFVTIQQISNELTQHQTGDSKLDRTTFQITAVAEKHLTAYQLRSAIITALNDFAGNLGEAGSTVAVKSCRHRGDVYLPLGPSDGGQRATAQWSVDFEVWHVTT